MQNLSSTVLVALGGALVMFGTYHVLVVAPRLRKLTAALDSHAAILGDGSGLPTDRVAALQASTRELTGRVHTIETVVQAVPHIGFVRYNAFENTGADLSYALALVSKSGDGVVISSIWSREETRTYGKAVTAFASVQESSNEEVAAIAKARAAAAAR